MKGRSSLLDSSGGRRGMGVARCGVAAALLATLPAAQAAVVREEGPIARLDALRERLQRHDRLTAGAAAPAALPVDAGPASTSAAPVGVAQWHNWRNFRNF